MQRVNAINYILHGCRPLCDVRQHKVGWAVRAGVGVGGDGGGGGGGAFIMKRFPFTCLFANLVGSIRRS